MVLQMESPSLLIAYFHKGPSRQLTAFLYVRSSLSNIEVRKSVLKDVEVLALLLRCNSVLDSSSWSRLLSLAGCRVRFTEVDSPMDLYGNMCLKKDAFLDSM